MKKYHGFTIVEILLYMILATIIMGVLTSMLVTTQQQGARARTVTTVQRELDTITNTIAAYIRQADNVTTPAPGGSSTSLSLDLAGTSHTFTVAGGEVTHQVGTSTPQRLSNLRVVATNFLVTATSVGSNNTVSINLTLAHINPDNDFNYDYNDTRTITETIY